MNKYTAFHHDCMCLSNSNRFDKYIKTSDGTNDTLPSISVIGEPNTLTELSWFTKDSINHSYFKYRYQPSLAGIELKFGIDFTSLDGIDDILKFEDIKSSLHIINNKDEISEIDLGFFGTVKSFSETIKFEGEIGTPYTIYLKNKYIKRDYPNTPISNVTLAWSLDGESGEGKSELDFEVLDYKEGIIRLLDTHLIPNNATVFINYKYHNQHLYHIQFSQIYKGNHPNSEDYKKVDVSDVKEVKISFSGFEFRYNLKFFDWEVTRGDLNYLPSKLKDNDIKSSIDFDRVYFIPVKRNLKNLLNLGYSKNISFNIGKELFGNIVDGFIDIQSPLSIPFKNYLKEFLLASLDMGIENISIIIPSDLKHLPLEFYQKDELGNNSKYINPINSLCIELISNIVNEIKTLNDTNIKLSFLIEDFCWHDINNRASVFDDFTLEAYKKDHTNNDIEEYNLNDYLSQGLDYDGIVGLNADIRVCKWLNDKLINALFTLRERCDIEAIIHTSCLFSNNLKGLLNNPTEYINSLYNNSASLIELSMDFSEFTEVSVELISKLDNLGYSKERFNFSITKIDELEDINIDIWQNVNDWIHLAYFSSGATNISIHSLYSIIRDNYFLYRPSTYVELKNIDTRADIILCRANKTEIGYLSTSKITNLDVSITQTNSLSIKVPFFNLDRFSHKRVINPFYYDVVEERLIKLNNDYFIIKEVSETDSDTKYKTISCQSLESKLSKSEVRIETVSLQIHSDDGFEDGVLNLLEKETGWKAGYIEPSIKFEKVDNVTVAKHRWFENITTDWLSFLTNDVAKAFNCVLQFDTANMTINVYNANTLGTDRGLYLSKNNYIKSKEKKGDTNNIVTRLRCIGKDEIDISTVSLTGLNYIEDYSYFIEMGDVSEELQIALSKYNQIVIEANALWKEVNSKYAQDITLHSTLTYEVKQLQAQLEVLEDMKKAYLEQEDIENANKIYEQIKELQIKLDTTNETIRLLKIDIDKNTELLKYLSSQLDKTTTVDENGELIFTSILLSELNNFVYWDTFTDTSYDTPEKLLEGGLREMALRSKPSVTYEIDSINFLEQLLDTNRKIWKQGVYLGDILILQDIDNKTEETLFFVGYTLNYEDKSLKIRISNKKSDISSTVAISNLLSDSKNVKKTLENKMYLLNKIKIIEGE